MTNKKFHLFTWLEYQGENECQRGPSGQYGGSFDSIEKAIDAAGLAASWRDGDDCAEIITEKNGALFVVATGMVVGGDSVWGFIEEPMKNDHN